MCGFEDSGVDSNWLITQYINITSPDVTQLTVNVTYSVAGGWSCSTNVTNCSGLLRFKVYETSFSDENGRSAKSSYSDDKLVIGYSSESLNEVTDTSEAIQLSGSYTGMYLALVDEGGCSNVSQLVVFYYACPEQVAQGVVYPETLSPVDSTGSVSVFGMCVQNSSNIGNGQPQLQCGADGQWTTVAECRCVKGYAPSMEICIGTVVCNIFHSKKRLLD